MGVGGQLHAQAALPPGNRSSFIVQEAGWAPGPVWTAAKNPAPTGIRSWTAQLVASRYTAIPCSQPAKNKTGIFDRT